MAGRDTSPEARAVQLRAYARMGPERRAALAFEMSEQAREIAIDGVRQRNPSWSPRRQPATLLGTSWAPELGVESLWRRLQSEPAG